VYDCSTEYVSSTPKGQRWDLSLVLRAIMEEPFEPIERASLKNITLKMVFLVALATAQRRSELHALSYEEISFNKERGRSNWHLCQAFW
jgi:integrase